MDPGECEIIMTKTVHVKAYAKINLGLDVLRRRPDGYHDLRMIMQTVTLYDNIGLTLTKAPGIRISTNSRILPSGEDNLACKAAKQLLDEFSCEQGVYIDLDKHIPIAAGLAGGSADAAAVLTGLNRLMGLGLSPEALRERGVKIGADVPYCILQGTALAEGIGEKLTALPPLPDCAIILVKPPVHISTKYVYEHLKADALQEHPDIDGQIEAIRAGDLKGLAEKAGNVLETVTIPEFPVIRQIQDHFRDLGALNSMMSGSGPTVFGIFDDRGRAKAACGKMRNMGIGQVFLTVPYRGNTGDCDE